MPSCALPASVLQVGTAMGRGPQQNPAFTKIFEKADRGVDLEKAWRQHGSPTTLKNMQRAYKRHREAAAAAASATPAGASRPRSGGAAGVSKAAKTPATRTGASVSIAVRQMKLLMAPVATVWCEQAWCTIHSTRSLPPLWRHSALAPDIQSRRDLAR